MMNLPVFPVAPTLSAPELVASLVSSGVSRVVNFVLGPSGTNMEQACQAWTSLNMLEGKTEIVLCRTPEESLAQARLVTEEGVVPLFWTCAVFYALNQLFFNNPDTFPFLFSHNMSLDDMQLCVRKGYEGRSWSKAWWIASHPSPAPLVTSLGNYVVKATSNAQAALLCGRGEVAACITTAQAARIHGLATVHEFGSPVMVFFGGTTWHGIEVLLGR